MLAVALAILLVTNGPPAHEPAVAAAWQYVDVFDGVHVWSAEETHGYWGHARGTVDAPADAIFERVSDFEWLPGRYPFLDATRIIARDRSSAVVYFHYDLPWPLSDREHTAAYRWWREPSGVITLAAEDAGALAPADKDAVHIEGFRVRMKFAPIREGATTDVEYMFRADFGGTLPRSVRRQTAWKIPLNVILAIRRSLRAPSAVGAAR